MTALPAAAPRRLHGAAAFACTVVGYLVAGVAALPITVPPGYVAPIYPAAGVGMAAVLLRGAPMVPAVAIGATAAAFVQLMVHRSGTVPATLLAALVIGVGAALQSFIGAALIRRQVRDPEALADPRDIAHLVGAAALACLVNTTIGNSALLGLGSIRGTNLPLAVSTWWIGDLLGVLIALPVILALRGRPEEAWTSRRLGVGATMALLPLLMVAGLQPLIRREEARVQAAVDRDVDQAAQALELQWVEPLHALEALHGVFLVDPDITTDEVQAASRAWLAGGRSPSFRWSVPVQRGDVAAFEASVRAAGQPRFRVHGAGAPPERAGGGASRLVVVREVAPRTGQDALLGTDLTTLPSERDALERASRSGVDAAAAPRSTPAGPGSAVADEPEVSVYRALYDVRDPTRLAPELRAAAARGWLSVAIRPAAALARLDPLLARRLTMCIVDLGTGAGTGTAPPARLAGPPGCETRPPGKTERLRTWRFADRDWQLRVGPEGAQPRVASHADAWLFALVGLVWTALLGGFVLTLTGRTRRIEIAVRERTAALQAEVQDRQAAENTMRESEQRFRGILDHVPIGVVYTELDGRVRQVNPTFCRMLGRTEAELLQGDIEAITHPDDRPQVRRLRDQLLAGEIPLYRRRRRYLTGLGEVLWAQVTVSLLRGPDGEPHSLVGVAEDIHEHRLLEAAERGREAAEAANRAKSDFLSRMSHELRTPLNAMLGFAQLLELDPVQPLTDSQKPWVAQIQQAGWHLLEMINDVLDLSRIELGNLRLRIEPLDLPGLVAAARAMVEGDARQRGLHVAQRIDLGDATPLGDPTRVKQILINLLSNAVKYNADGGRIEIAARRADDDRVELTVSDTGLGMTPEQLARLFQPFNRLGRERSAQAGTGIGLVISQRLAELMGGSLTVRSRAREGTDFLLTLPCSSEPDTIRDALEPPEAAEARYPRRRVCYIEDNETNVEVMQGILAQRPQVEMSVALTGLEGLATIRATPPDLVLLDMHLPDLDGLELLRRLRADPATRAIPVVVVSADALAEQIAAAFDAGCDRYLTKPVSVGEVLAVIDELLIAEV